MSVEHEHEAAAPAEDTPSRLPFTRRVLRLLFAVLFTALLVIMVLWAAAAVYYSSLPAAIRPVLAVVMVVVGLWAAVNRKRRTTTRPWLIGAWLAVLCYWLLIKPSNDRDWALDVAVLPTVVFDGDRVTIGNVRNCTYRSADDYTPAYEERTYDLSRVQSVGLGVSFFSSLQDIAHTFLTFGFSDGQYLPISIEVRKERDETYSPVSGLFKQFEIIYVVGDERDIIGSRTTYRDEDVYLYPLSLEKDQIRALLVDMLEETGRLTSTARFYNTIYPNCTTSIVQHIRTVMPGRAQLDIRMLLNGFSDQMAYERGAIATDLPFEEARQAFRINAVARAAQHAPDFSQQIRQAWPADLR